MELEGVTQKNISLAVDLKNHAELVASIEDSCNVCEKARMNSLTLPNAGA